VVAQDPALARAARAPEPAAPPLPPPAHPSAEATRIDVLALHLRQQAMARAARSIDTADARGRRYGEAGNPARAHYHSGPLASSPPDDASA
jgi:hypothetical protein